MQQERSATPPETQPPTSNTQDKAENKQETNTNETKTVDNLTQPGESAIPPTQEPQKTAPITKTATIQEQEQVTVIPETQRIPDTQTVIADTQDIGQADIVPPTAPLQNKTKKDKQKQDKNISACTNGAAAQKVSTGKTKTKSLSTNPSDCKPKNRTNCK